MSLDTVLKIGKAFRASTNGLKHFRYVNPCPKDTEKQTITRLCLPVKQDFSFDFDNLTEITNQNIIGSDAKDTELYYLTFKTSDKDNNPIKYIFSDIYYGCEKGKEKGWYKTERKVKKATKKEPGKIEITNNSFYEGNKSDKPFCDKIVSKMDKKSPYIFLLNKFRQSFEENIDVIESDILKKYAAKNAFENIKASNQATKKMKELFGEGKETIEWSEIETSYSKIDKILENEKGRVFLHFDFTELGGKKYWYEYNDIFNAISAQMREEMTEEVIIRVDEVDFKGFAFKKELYRNICSGDEQGDKQFPCFNSKNRYKSFFFSAENVEDLYYGINSTENGLYLGKDLIAIILLPKGDNLQALHYEAFQKGIFQKNGKNLEDKNEESEMIIKRENENAFDFLSLFDEDDTISAITTFDVVFVNQGQNSDSDLVEISNIERSFLYQVFQNIKRVKVELYKKITKIERFEKQVSILYSLQQILGNGQTSEGKGNQKKVIFKVNPKYNAHLLKILPKIYTANYTEDNLLLPSFVKNVEYSIRQGDNKFPFLKYDLEFLLSIQNTLIPKQNFLKIMSSKSHELGKSIGKLALFLKPDREGDSLINSFEKEYVGNLSRHIGQLRDVQKFVSYLFEKYALHKEKARYIPAEVRNGQVTKQIEDILLEIQEHSNKISYDKNECAFGFFSSYFAPYESKKEDSNKSEN